MAHEVVHGGRRGGRGPEEHRRVAEHLPQAAIAHGAGGESVERRREQAGQAHRTAEDLGREEGARVVEVRVQEATPSDVVRGRRGVEVPFERRARAGFDRLEEGCVLGPRRAHVEGCVVAVGVHAIAGVERGELQLLGRARSEHAEEVVEHLRHEVPRGPGVEAEPVPLPGAGPAAERVARLEEGDAVPVAREQRRGREPGDAAADHDDPLGCRGHRPRPPAAIAERTAIASFSPSGTRMRVAISRSAGVSRHRAASFEKRPCAAATAARARRGSSRIVRPAISRS